MVTQVSLDDAMLAECVKRYIDEDKPDSLQQKQMESWRLQWENSATDATLLPFTPTHRVSGTLTIQGEYIVVVLTTDCSWTGDCEDGSLFFSCKASARWIDDESKESKSQAKIRKKMVERLQKDEHIQKLFQLDSTGESDDSLELCQATIQMSAAAPESPDTPRLEERVHCSEETAEAICRAIFSTAESPLDVFDFVCRLSILPCTTLTTIVPHTTPLADRAKLRILEDATYDACEKEEDENDLEQELNNIEEEANTKKKSKR